MSEKIEINSQSQLEALLSNNSILDSYSIKMNYNYFIEAIKGRESVIKFENCDIEITNSTCQKAIIRSQITFNKCDFLSNLEVEDVILCNDLTFTECNFDYTDSSLFIQHISTPESIGYINIRIYNCSNLQNITISDIVHFNNLKIEIIGDYNNINTLDLKNIPLKKYDTESGLLEYSDYVFLENELTNEDYSSISCMNCEFKVNMDFDSDTSDIELYSCVFFKDCDISEITIDNLKIYNSTFHNKLIIYKSTINIIKLINCTFRNTVKIINLKNTLNSLSLERSTIKGMFFFNGFKEENIDSCISISEKPNISDESDEITEFDISFEHIFIEPTGYLIIRKIKNGFFLFDYANILGHIVMQDIDINCFQMRNASIIGSLSIQDIKLNYLNLENTSLIGKLIFNTKNKFDILKLKSKIIKNRHTAYLLKKGKLDEGDNINSLLLKRKELRLYLKENKGINSIVLFFNWISNDFGHNWFIGFVFTITSSYIFYFLINFTGLNEPIFNFGCSLDGFGEAWKGYLKILNVLNFKDKLEGVPLTAWGETLFFVSKIFVSYGIYQTVSAFRKFGK